MMVILKTSSSLILSNTATAPLPPSPTAHGEVAISHQIRSAVSHVDPWDILTFSELHNVTAAFLTFHKRSDDFMSEQPHTYPHIDL